MMKFKIFFFACLMTACLVFGIISAASAQYTLFLEATNAGGTSKYEFGRGEDLYLHIVANDPAGIAGCAVTVNYPPSVLIAPDTGSEGVSG